MAQQGMDREQVLRVVSVYPQNVRFAVLEGFDNMRRYQNQQFNPQGDEL